MKELLKRMKSPVLWIEAVLIVAQIGKATGLYDLGNETVSQIQDIITIGFSLFATLNNPTETKKF